MKARDYIEREGWEEGFEKLITGEVMGGATTDRGYSYDWDATQWSGLKNTLDEYHDSAIDSIPDNLWCDPDGKLDRSQMDWVQELAAQEEGEVEISDLSGDPDPGDDPDAVDAAALAEMEEPLQEEDESAAADDSTEAQEEEEPDFGLGEADEPDEPRE